MRHTVVKQNECVTHIQELSFPHHNLTLDLCKRQEGDEEPCSVHKWLQLKQVKVLVGRFQKLYLFL